MPTSVDLKCPHKGCGLPLRIARKEDKKTKFTCDNKHETFYTERYLKRFLSSENVRGDLSKECSRCHTPICVRDRVAQDDAKQRGRVECSVCGLVQVYRADIGKWVPEDD